MAGCLVKDGLQRHKMPRLAGQKAAFCNAKSHVWATAWQSGCCNSRAGRCGVCQKLRLWRSCRRNRLAKRHPVKLSLKRFTGCPLVTGSWAWPLCPRRVICRVVSLCLLSQVALWPSRCRIVCRAGSCRAPGRLCR